MRVLITGATGQLGPYLVDVLTAAGADVVAWSGHRSVRITPAIDSVPVPLDQPAAVARAWTAASPDVVVHAAAMARIDACHADPQQARRVNVQGTEQLCELADRAQIPLIYVSTDLVFDGERGMYREDDGPQPLSVYGQTKLAAERIVLATPRNAVLRVSLLYGPGRCGVRTFLDRVVQAWQEGKAVTFFDDEWRTPLALVDAARAVQSALDQQLRGLFHVGGSERLSRWEGGVRLAQRLGFPETLVVRASRKGFPAPEPRPADVSLCSERFRQAVPQWQPHRFPAPWLTVEQWRGGQGN